jgi:muramoyltetrapeptide carboxypeptidase
LPVYITNDKLCADMNRKFFLNASATLIAGAHLPLKSLKTVVPNEPDVDIKKPLYLKAGDTIGVTSPAGPSTIEEVQTSCKILESWGFKVLMGKTIGKKFFNEGGTDEERLTDFQEMINNPDVKAIMCSRGGYGCIRIVDKINWKNFIYKPKWVIGFSDITVLHSHIHRNCKVASIHSKMFNSFPDDLSKADPLWQDTIEYIHLALTGTKMHYSVQPNAANKSGSGQGVLVGGNLKTLETLACSASDISTDGKILFVEDTGEYLYSIDRMFWNLKRSGKLSKLKALIVGGFKVKPDDPGEEFGRTIQEIVLEKVHEYVYPVCFDFPVGHQRNNYPLKCGVTHELIVSPNEVTLTEVV